MKRTKFGLLLVTLCMMTGCTITAPGVRVKAPLPGVEIDLGAGHAGGVFCPPGQAKKGRC